MNPNRYSTVMEIFFPGGFAHDYQWTTRALGMSHIAIWNDTYVLFSLFSSLSLIPSFSQVSHLRNKTQGGLSRRIPRKPYPCPWAERRTDHRRSRGGYSCLDSLIYCLTFGTIMYLLSITNQRPPGSSPLKPSDIPFTCRN